MGRQTYRHSEDHVTREAPGVTKGGGHLRALAHAPPLTRTLRPSPTAFPTDLSRHKLDTFISSWEVFSNSICTPSHCPKTAYVRPLDGLSALDPQWLSW